MRTVNVRTDIKKAVKLAVSKGLREDLTDCNACNRLRGAAPYGAKDKRYKTTCIKCQGIKPKRMCYVCLKVKAGEFFSGKLTPCILCEIKEAA